MKCKMMQNLCIAKLGFVLKYKIYDKISVKYRKICSLMSEFRVKEVIFLHTQVQMRSKYPLW